MLLYSTTAQLFDLAYLRTGKTFGFSLFLFFLYGIIKLFLETSGVFSSTYNTYGDDIWLIKRTSISMPRMMMAWWWLDDEPFLMLRGLFTCFSGIKPSITILMFFAQLYGTTLIYSGGGWQFGARRDNTRSNLVSDDARTSEANRSVEPYFLWFNIR